VPEWHPSDYLSIPPRDSNTVEKNSAPHFASFGYDLQGLAGFVHLRINEYMERGSGHWQLITQVSTQQHHQQQQQTSVAVPAQPR